MIRRSRETRGSHDEASARIGQLDELRALAIAAVVLSHIAMAFGSRSRTAYWLNLPDLAVGVDLFFAISGFVIAVSLRQMVDAAEGDRVRAARAFYARRFFRIAIPAWATLVAIAIAASDKREPGHPRRPGLRCRVDGERPLGTLSDSEMRRPAPNLPLLVLGGGGAILSAGAAAHTRDRSESACGADFDVGRFGARSTPTWKPYVGPKTGRAPPRDGARSRRSRQRGLDASFSRALWRTGGVLAIHSRSCRPRGRGANVRHCLVGCRSDLRRDRGRPIEGLASDRAVRESYPGDRARIVLRLSRPSTDCSVGGRFRCPPSRCCVRRADCARGHRPRFMRAGSRGFAAGRAPWTDNFQQPFAWRALWSGGAELDGKAFEMSRTFFFAALAGLTLSTPVAADTLGCTVLLCTSPGAPPWQSIPECVQPVMTAYWMADHGMGWPQCPEAAGSQSSIGTLVRRVGVWATTKP